MMLCIPAKKSPSTIFSLDRNRATLPSSVKSFAFSSFARLYLKRDDEEAFITLA
jgi:hypothetical protein